MTEIRKGTPERQQGRQENADEQHESHATVAFVEYPF